MCETCAHEYDASLEEAWPGERTYQMPEERQDQAAVPEPKAGGWFSRLRS